MRERSWPGLVVLIMALTPLTAASGDGVLEISQACVAQGCFPGDSPGLPIDITQSGSYRLTSDLVAPAASDVSGVDIQADDVTLDLNGFAVRNESASSTADGITSSNRDRIEIRNGLIIGWGGDGIAARNTNSQDHRMIGLRVSGNTGDGMDLAGRGQLVRDCSITGNGQIGILMLADGSGMVIDSIIRDNANLGLSAFGDAFAGNTTAGNNGGNTNQQVGSAVAIGCNMIGAVAACP